MLKWALLIIFLTVVDVLATLELLTILEPVELIVLYFLTTIAGAFLLFLRRADFKASRQFAETELAEAFRERASGIFRRPTAKDFESLRPLILVGGYYVPAIILIAIPGVLSDLVGILLATPAVSNQLVDRQIKKGIEENAKSTP